MGRASKNKRSFPHSTKQHHGGGDSGSHHASVGGVSLERFANGKKRRPVAHVAKATKSKSWEERENDDDIMPSSTRPLKALAFNSTSVMMMMVMMMMMTILTPGCLDDPQRRKSFIRRNVWRLPISVC